MGRVVKYVPQRRAEARDPFTPSGHPPPSYERRDATKTRPGRTHGKDAEDTARRRLWPSAQDLTGATRSLGPTEMEMLRRVADIYHAPNAERKNRRFASAESM